MLAEFLVKSQRSCFNIIHYFLLALMHFINAAFMLLLGKMCFGKSFQMVVPMAGNTHTALLRWMSGISWFVAANLNLDVARSEIWVNCDGWYLDAPHWSARYVSTAI